MLSSVFCISVKLSLFFQHKLRVFIDSCKVSKKETLFSICGKDFFTMKQKEKKKKPSHFSSL